MTLIEGIVRVMSRVFAVTFIRDLGGVSKELALDSNTIENFGRPENSGPRKREGEGKVKHEVKLKKRLAELCVRSSPTSERWS